MPDSQPNVALRNWDAWGLRAVFVVCMAGLGASTAPFGLKRAAAGFAASLLVLLAEQRLRRVARGILLGAMAGGLAGLSAALLLTLILSRTPQADAGKTWLAYASVAVFVYLGIALGAHRGQEVQFLRREKTLAAVAPPDCPVKLLDTSVLIDGRIADVCEAHFMEGTLIVPRFVLRELQMVADSSDGLKRQRGRRGLDVLERMRKLPQIHVRVEDEAVLQAAEVDHKLVELALRMGAKIVTNDFNLNKVATVQGVVVLNVNQLANALKPVVLPGEAMRVLVLREGKEANQGIAYLEDGTMVVVDGARRLINKTVDIIVTSVHQTTAGKMIFGRLDERSEPAAAHLRHAAAAGSGSSLPPRADAPAVRRIPRQVYPEPDVD